MTKWSVPALAAAFAFGAVTGGAFTQPQPLRAATTPVIAVYEANVTDPDGYKEKYLPLVMPKAEKAGFKFLARGKTQTLIGDEAKNRVVITEAPSMDAQMAFWNDAKEDFKIGQKYSTGMRLIIVEGVSQ